MKTEKHSQEQNLNLGEIPLSTIRRIEWTDQRSIVVTYAKDGHMTRSQISADQRALIWLTSVITRTFPGIEVCGVVAA